MKLKNVTNSFVGSIAEWYEFVAYGFCAPFLASLFFPSHRPLLSIMAVFGTFAVGFLARPLGALIFGYFGDKHSRKKAMSFSVVLIGLPTLIMGIMPTYQTIGIFAPILLLVTRILQGISVGGQFTGSAIFIAEHIGHHRKYLGAGLTFSGAFVGMLLASFIGAILTRFLTNQQLAIWGWRIPFILGIFITILGFYIKTHTTEPQQFIDLKKRALLSKNPILNTFQTEKLPMLLTGLVCWLTSMIVYQLFIFMPTYVHTFLHTSLGYALKINTLMMILLAILTILFGFLSDYIGYKRVMILGALFFVICGFPIYYLLSIGRLPLLLTQLLFAIFGAAFIGPLMSVLSGRFHIKTRYTALSFSYNMGFGIFGGTCALMSLFLVKKTHLIYAPGIYLSVAALISLIALIMLTKKFRKSDAKCKQAKPDDHPL